MRWYCLCISSNLYFSIYKVIQSVSSHTGNAPFWLLSTYYNAFSSLAHFSLPLAWTNWCVLWRSFCFLYQRTHRNLEFFLLGIQKSVLSISLFLWTQRKKIASQQNKSHSKSIQLRCSTQWEQTNICTAFQSEERKKKQQFYIKFCDCALTWTKRKNWSDYGWVTTSKVL